MQSRSRLIPVEDDAALIGEEQPTAPPKVSRTESALTTLLWTSLRTLSQRTVVALAALVDLLLIGSAFALWITVIAQPSVLQLVGVGGYALFILAALALRRRS